MRMQRGVQFAVCLPNRPGAFWELSEKLAARDINIIAFMLYNTNYVMNVPNVPLVSGTCKMILDNDQEARKGFRDLGIEFWEQEVILLRAADRPGILATVLERLAEAGLNLKEGYASIPVEEDGVLIVLAVSKVQQALFLLAGLKEQLVVSIRSN